MLHTFNRSLKANQTSPQLIHILPMLLINSFLYRHQDFIIYRTKVWIVRNAQIMCYIDSKSGISRQSSSTILLDVLLKLKLVLCCTVYRGLQNMKYAVIENLLRYIFLPKCIKTKLRLTKFLQFTIIKRCSFLTDGMCPLVTVRVTYDERLTDGVNRLHVALKMNKWLAEQLIGKMTY